MTTPEPKLTDEQLQGLIRRYRELDVEAKALAQEAKSIKEQIADDVAVGWSMTVDGITASKRAPNREFSLALGVAILPADVRAACKVTKFDDKLVREQLKKLGIEDDAMQDKPEANPVVKLS